MPSPVTRIRRPPRATNSIGLTLHTSGKGLIRAIVLVGVLVAVAAALLWATSSPDLSEELARLALALRADPSPENYRQLSRFADEYASSEWSAQADFALGLADFGAERWTAARDRFHAARASRWLRDYATLYLARAEAERGTLETARHVLEEFSFRGSLLEEQARVLKADLLVRVGQPRAAVDWLKQQPDLWSRPALLYALAQAQWAAGQAVVAAETLHRVYYEFPLSPEAEPSNQLLAQVRAHLKAQYPVPSEALRRKRAETLWAQQAYRGARSAYVDLSVRASEPTRTEARLRAALALYNLGDARAACEELGTISHVGAALEAEFRAYRVRCALRDGDSRRVEDDLAFLAQHFPASEWYEAALLAAGNTALAHGDTQQARDYYQRLVEAAPAADPAVEAHWKLAWLTYRAGEMAAATRLMEEHLQRFPESPFLPRALYWRAQLALAAADVSLAKHLLAVLQQSAPRDYLAQQAQSLAQRLQGSPAGDPPPSPPWLEALMKEAKQRKPIGLPPAMRALVEKARALERLGLWELAEEVLEAARRQLPHPEIYLAQARVAFAQQKYARATETLQRAHLGYWRYHLDDLPREAWELMFPLPYWEIILRESRRQRLDPYLVAALIRQESRFEREARSSAGALGLMQLMPGTARSLARSRRLPQSRILDPTLNIRLGARFLARLLRRFDGSVEKAVAAYNAGGTRVAEWAAADNFSEPAEFVESIPVTQTREFVYTVLRNYRFYRDLYTEP